MNDYLLSRYERQLVLPGWSVRKQLLLANTHLTLDPELSLAALYGAAAGVGGIEFTDPGRLNPELATKLKSINPALKLGPPSSGSFDVYAIITPQGAPFTDIQTTLLATYSVQGGVLKLDLAGGSNGQRTIEYPLSNFASSHHVISLLAVSILLEEVSRM